MKRAILEIESLIKKYENDLSNHMEFFKSKKFKENSTSDGQFEIEHTKKFYEGLIDELKIAKKILKNKLTCSFCEKEQDKVEYLISGNNVYICEECVQKCDEILKEKSKEKEVDHEKETQTQDDADTVKRL